MAGEKVRAFVPRPMPIVKPPMFVNGELARLHSDALAAIGDSALPVAKTYGVLASSYTGVIHRDPAGAAVRDRTVTA